MSEPIGNRQLAIGNRHMFGQSFDTHDLAVIALLIVLEGVLSIDNALVLGLLAKRVPKRLQHKALTYGLIGAFVFRIIAIATATLLIQIRWVKLLGGAYLIYVAVKHFFFETKEHAAGDHEKIALDRDGNPILVDKTTGRPVSEAEAIEELRQKSPSFLAPPDLRGRSESAKFWMTVIVIELTDIAFAVDSILAAVGLVAGRDKTWVVISGGFLGVVLMRFAAALFIKLLDRFPRFELAAYLLVLLIGLKLAVDWYFNPDPHHPRVNFHSPTTAAFWIFWSAMAIAFATGFLPEKRHGDGGVARAPNHPTRK
jgi:YkoY family integral membrane protein